MSSVNEQKGRKNWIDILRAIAIIFVMAGHLYENKTFYLVTGPIKLPLFFAITGYVFNFRSGNVKEFFLNLLRTLVAPLLYFSVVLLPMKCIASYMGWIDHTVGEVLHSFLTGDEFWYLPCLIIAEIIFFFILKSSKNKNIHFLLMILAAAVGFILAEFNILRVCNINTAFCAQLFILIGYFYKCYEPEINKLKHYGWIVSIVLYCGLLYLSYRLYPNSVLDIHNNRYYSYIITIPMIFIGNFGLFSLFSKIEFPPNVLTFIGSNTLVYYIFHEYCFGALIVLVHKLNLDSTNFWINLIVLALTIGICALISVVVKKYVPFLVGAKKSKKGT